MKIDILKFIKVEELSAAEREQLRKRLQARRDLLTEAMEVVDAGLKRLDEAPKVAKKGRKGKR
jgi:hypothetical protein